MLFRAKKRLKGTKIKNMTFVELHTSRKSTGEAPRAKRHIIAHNGEVAAIHRNEVTQKKNFALCLDLCITCFSIDSITESNLLQSSLLDKKAKESRKTVQKLCDGEKAPFEEN